jgi:catechol 2,3-dioxygenase-like lactoylglutathione lyase family enzyme
MGGWNSFGCRPLISNPPIRPEDTVISAITTVEPGLEFVVTATLIVQDIERSTAFYRDVLGAELLRRGEPTFLRLGNIWLTINLGGGPTDDKPEVTATPPRNPDDLSLFLNLRVSDIHRFYRRWSSLGARFITEPKTHTSELRCYIRDPDGYLIEVGQTTFTATPLDLYR